MGNPCSRTANESLFGQLERKTSQVILHLYYHGNMAKTQRDVQRQLLQGYFHCGVEVYDQEWSFMGPKQENRGSGVFCCQPARCPGFSYSESLPLGVTYLPLKQVQKLLQGMAALWTGISHDPRTRHSCHFCDHFCMCLGVGSIPDYLTGCSDEGSEAKSWVSQLLHIDILHGTISRKLEQLMLCGIGTLNTRDWVCDGACCKDNIGSQSDYSDPVSQLGAVYRVAPVVHRRALHMLEGSIPEMPAQLGTDAAGKYEHESDPRCKHDSGTRYATETVIRDQQESMAMQYQHETAAAFKHETGPFVAANTYPVYEPQPHSLPLEMIAEASESKQHEQRLDPRSVPAVARQPNLQQSGTAQKGSFQFILQGQKLMVVSQGKPVAPVGPRLLSKLEPAGDRGLFASGSGQAEQQTKPWISGRSD